MKNKKGVLSQLGVKSKNGRIYPSDVMSKAIEKYQEQIENGTAIGELDHPIDSNAIVSLSRASHIVTSINLKFPKVPRKKKKKMKKEGKYNIDTYEVSYRFLNTKFGKVAKKVKKNLVPALRGFGSVNSQGVIQDDYELLAIDLISKKNKA